MRTEDILAQPPTVLTPAQRASYFEQGYLALESAVSMDWIERLRTASAEMIERSRALAKSNAVFDLEPGHRADAPRLRRVSSPPMHHPDFWEFASQSVVVEIAADLVGPDVKFHHSKLNYKWFRGGEEVKWHQDIQYWPHTNYTPLTIGVYLYDCGPEQAPLGVIPGSHEGELFDQYDGQGRWVGCIGDGDLARVPLEQAVYLPGPAGSLTIHNCRTIHGSAPNLSQQARPLLLNVYSSADAFPYTFNPLQSPQAGTVVRGRPARHAHHDPRPCLVPPDWSAGYSSLFAMQQAEDWDPEQQAGLKQHMERSARA